MSVIIIMVINISGEDIVFYEIVKHIDFWKIAHVLKHLHGRIILGPFEIFFHEGSLWRGHISIISFIITKHILCIYFVMGIGFIINIQIQQYGLNILMTMVWLWNKIIYQQHTQENSADLVTVQ